MLRASGNVRVRVRVVIRIVDRARVRVRVRVMIRVADRVGRVRVRCPALRSADDCYVRLSTG